MNESFLRAKSNISTTRKTFWWSLGIGTGMELAFLITSWKALLFVELFYLLVTVLFNLIVFLNNIIFVCLHKEERTALLLSTLLLLLNILSLICTSLYFFINQ